MKNDKYLIELLQHLSNRPLLFFLCWGVVVVFFLYLFLGLQKERNKRYFKEDATTQKKSGKALNVIKSEEKTDLEP